MCSGVSDWALLSPSRVSPFGNPRITVRLPTPRGLSQVPTSFIGSWCQGIHRVPLLTWPQRCSRPLCSSQGTGGPATWSAPAAARMSRAELGACVQRRFTGVSVRVRPEGRSVRSGDARSLRTQQRAEASPQSPEPFHPLPRGRGGGVLGAVD
jgi:hypothetical protein